MNFYNLRQAINESASATRVETGTHEFFGGITESFNEFNQMMSESAFDIDSDIRMGNEIMLEAVTMGVSARDFETINESIGGTVVAKIKAFFKSIVEYIKGLLAKLKTFMSSLSNNTSTWHTKMKAAVEKAGKDRSITADFTWESYKWDLSKLDGLHDRAEKLRNLDDGDDFRLDNIDQYMKKLVDVTNEGLKNCNVATSQGVKEIQVPRKREVETAFKDYKNTISNSLGIRGDSDNYKSVLAEEVKGKSMSTQKDIGSKYSSMLEFIDKCSDKIGNISDLYEKSKDDFEKAIDALDRCEIDDVEYVSGIPDDNRKVIVSLRDGFSSDLTYTKRCVTYGQGVFNGICSLQVSLTKECAQAYMKTLSKLAMAKPKK